MRAAAVLLALLALAGLAALWLTPASPAPGIEGQGVATAPLEQDAAAAPTTTLEAGRAAVVASGPEHPQEPAEAREPVPEVHRLTVVDAAGNPLPDAVAVREDPPGEHVGFPADAAGCIAIPRAVALDALTVLAPGHLPEVLNGVRPEERVELAPAMRVQVEVTEGWQRLPEGWEGATLAGEFRAHLEARVPGADEWDDPPLVELRLPDGSRESVELGRLAAVLHSPVSPLGRAAFQVVEPGPYGVELTWRLKPNRGSADFFVVTILAEPDIAVRPGEGQQEFRVRVTERSFETMRRALDMVLDDD